MRVMFSATYPISPIDNHHAPSSRPHPSLVDGQGDAGKEGSEGVNNVDSWESDVREAEKLVAMNQLPAALAKYERVCRSCPGWTSGWERVVSTLARLNRWERVREVCEKYAAKEQRREFSKERYDPKAGAWVKRTLPEARVLNSEGGGNDNRGREWVKEVAMR